MFCFCYPSAFLNPQNRVMRKNYVVSLVLLITVEGEMRRKHFETDMNDGVSNNRTKKIVYCD